MKKIVLLLLLGLFPTFISAVEAEIDGIRYELYSDTREAAIIGYNEAYYTSELNIPSSVSYEGTDYSVTSILSFYGNYGPPEVVTIPSSVTYIDRNPFAGCLSYMLIFEVSEDNPIYYSDCGCVIEKENNRLIIGGFRYEDYDYAMEIPDGVTSISGDAFYGYENLTSVFISNSVTSVEGNPFVDCANLTSIEVDSENNVFDSRENCNAIIETASNTLVAGCNNTIIPSSVTSIGNLAFSGCSGLTSITIPEGVTSIGESAFSGCSGLTSITIPEGVTSIGDHAFSGCSGLTSITIPEGVTSIGYEAFRGCSSLTSIKVESDNPIFDSRENCNAIIETASNTLVAGCNNTIIPSSVTSIGDYAFVGCSSLTSITIPSSVTSIGYFAFSGCI